MKRFFILALTLALALGLLACSSRTPAEPPSGPAASDAPSSQGMFLFPKDTVLFQLRLDGMSARQAQAALKKAVDAYTLTASVGDHKLSLSGKDLKLRLDADAFQAWASALENGEKAGVPAIISYAPANEIAAYLSKQLSQTVQNASVAYQKDSEKFEPVPGRDGCSLDAAKVQPLLEQALSSGQSLLKLDGVAVIKKPTVTLKEPGLKTAAQEANRYLELSLTYTYAPEGEAVSRQAITRAELASFLTVRKDFSVAVNPSGVENYVSRMAERYNAPGRRGAFHTTGGNDIGYTVDYYGQSLNQAAMAEDLTACLENGTSGVREAPYYAAGAYSHMAYGGNYVEIDLSAQQLWVYRNGEQKVSAPIVSGCVAKGYETPTGIYSVEDWDTDATLVGDDYETHVDYWIGFLGGYGIHDANWRWDFGGDIYLYSGSHGCVNVSPYQAELIHSNTALGTKVILYGGADEVEPLKQEISCQDIFDVAEDAAPFPLNAALKYEDDGEDERAVLTYSSSNPAVATVSKDGKVTVKGVGTTTITLKIPAFTYHTAGKLEVTVKVHSACDEGRHSFGDWTVTKEATCQAGEEKRTCSKCGETETREIPATGEHTWGDWVVTAVPSCRDGEESRTCSICGETETRPIPATGEHSWGDWVVTVAPSCRDGEESRTCSICGETETRPIPATGEHSWGDWVITVEPGCETPGQRVSTCLICGETRTEEIPPLGHDFVPEEEFCRRGCGAVNPDYTAPALPDPLILRIRRWCF